MGDETADKVVVEGEKGEGKEEEGPLVGRRQKFCVLTLHLALVAYLHASTACSSHQQTYYVGRYLASSTSERRQWQ